MSANVAPNIVTDGLIIYMDAANTKSYPGSGTVWTELSQFPQATGTLINGAVYDSANKGSIVVDGINDRITVPVANANNTFTINIWVKPIANGTTGSTGYMGLVQRFNGVNNQRNRFMLQQAFNTLYFQAIIGGINYDIFSDTFPSIQNQITMCTVTWDGAVVKFYINGVSVLATPVALTGTLDSGSSAPYLGWGATSQDYYMNGKFYNYQVYNIGLSSTQVLQNYNALKSRFTL